MISSRSASGSPSWPGGVVVHDHAAGHDPVVGSGVGGEPLTASRWRSAGRAGPVGPPGRRARAGAARIAKNTLGWTTPTLRTPEQADRWTSLTIAAYTRLRLARGLVDELRLPWDVACQREPLPTHPRPGFARVSTT